MAARLGRPLITVSCHDDLSAADLVGRHLIGNGSTVWADGPLTRAVREGAIVYLDEVVEARKDTTVVLHPLADDRRILPIERTGEQLKAPPEFMLVISYNPGYQSLLKGLKPSTRQRFTALTLILSLQASYAAPMILLAQNRQDDRDRVQIEQDRQRAERALADTEFLAREVVSLRLAIQELPDRDVLRAELRALLAELDASSNGPSTEPKATLEDDR